MRASLDKAHPTGVSATTVPPRVLPVLLAAQFCGTSLWFAANAVMPDLQAVHGWPVHTAASLVSWLQAGFIAGTLFFALLAIADRFPPRRVFLVCSLLGALCTLASGWSAHDLLELKAWRAAAGFCLAGIYPVGMKIASQWYRQGLGHALGWLLAALILGSAAPHALRGWAAMGVVVDWQWVFPVVAVLVVVGGLVQFLLLPDAPAPSVHVQQAQRFDWRALGTLWTDRKVRASVFGYFGHMWELYAMWVAVPLLLSMRLDGAAVSFAAFAVLGAGAISCAWGGHLSQRWGSARVAAALLATSGLCGLLTPAMVGASDLVFYGWLAVWGLSVSSDSPQFSALTARNAPPHAVGSVLTLTNSIGFTISIVSIEWMAALLPVTGLAWSLPLLAVGPLIGLWMLRPLLQAHSQQATA
ncbi:MAG: MFS transporter [Burkholderiaceae bacterium]|jgi:MFS transporter, DHA1 family, inner membrane transport protein